MLNKYFNNFAYGREQDLVEDLSIECLKIYGHNVRYIPKTLVRDDPLFGEDTLRTFDAATELEMYIKNVEGFDGEGDFLSKFNLEIRDQVTLTVARKRFDQAKTEKLATEVGYNFLTESANTNNPSRKFLSETANTFSIMLEDGTGEGFTITTNRPMEGDLIFFPLNRKLFEIKFVEHEDIFYQTGRLQTYDLRCELFEYSGERISTGNTSIDLIATTYSPDILAYEMLLQTGDKLLDENGGTIMQEYRVEDTQPTANNEYFQSNDPVFSSDAIIDFSETNPFSETDRY